MLRIILAIIIGFIVWSILWVGSDMILMSALPDWYGKHHKELEAAVTNKTAFMSDSVILVIGLIRSVIFSIISGFLAALIAKENSKSTLGLGILLLTFGIFIQSIYWNYSPLWYHLSFLVLLIPMTVLGGKLKKS
ncbi:MAG TPA: hypothetical protein PKE69_06640 [Pyrinomonadaceae bacterium]|nr:hypothetical protein [Pyrinomonadaceae bacterium]